MSHSPLTITDWIEELRGGRETAAQQLWDHFLMRLTQLVCRRLRTVSKTTSDEEDVVLEACNACFAALKNGKYPKVKNRNDLWKLLAVIAERKAIDQIRRSNKGIEGLRVDSPFKRISAESSVMDGMMQLPCTEPTPDFAVVFEENLREKLNTLQPSLRSVAVWKMQGYTNQEISERIGRSIATVERYLKSIRTLWHYDPDQPD